MIFQNEQQFENYIRKLINTKIISSDPELVMLDNKKTVDIMLCRNGKKAALFFIEIKYYKNKHYRLSTGHKNGGGFQPEILAKQPDYFKKNMLWILGNEQSHRFWLLSNKVVAENLSGKDGIGKKYNNIKLSIFNVKLSISRKQLIKSLKMWLGIGSD